jgi:uncharacterized protein
MYQPRTYRNWVKSKDLVNFRVMVEETDCYIGASIDLQVKTRRLIEKYRGILKKYISARPIFLTTLEPFQPGPGAPQIVTAMCEAGELAGVGPMAAVAGAIAQFVGNDLLRFSPEMIIENGGDIYLHSRKERLLGIFAGRSPLSGKIGIALPGQEGGLGISTSSGTVGHSLSFGQADAALVIADSAVLSDAVATSVGNLVQNPADIQVGIAKARGIPGVNGVVIIKDEEMGLWGDVNIQQIDLSEFDPRP